MPRPTLSPGDQVTLAADVDTVERPALAVVVDHAAADMAPPTAEDLVLVRWSRTTLTWEYIEDLVLVERARTAATS